MRTAPRTTESLILTSHASLRFAQRGISEEAAEFVFLNGSDMPAGFGAKKRYLTRQKISELLSDKYPIALVDAAARLELIITADEVVVTGYRRDPNRQKPHKGTRATGNRHARR